MSELSISLLSSSSTVPWGIPNFHLARMQFLLTRNQPQRLRLPEEVGSTAPHRFLPFRFPVSPSFPHKEESGPISSPHLFGQLGKKNFRGNHETPAQFTYGDFDSDIADVEVVVKYLTSKHGYVVTMIVSHSKASMVTMRYLCTSKEVAANVRCFVNVAGRYRMVRSIVIHFW